MWLQEAFSFVLDAEVTLLIFCPLAGISSSNILWLDQVDLNYSVVTGGYVIYPFHFRIPTSDSSDGFRIMFNGKSCGKKNQINVGGKAICYKNSSLLEIKPRNKRPKHLLLLVAKVCHTSLRVVSPHYFCCILVWQSESTYSDLLLLTSKPVSFYKLIIFMSFGKYLPLNLCRNKNLLSFQNYIYIHMKNPIWQHTYWKNTLATACWHRCISKILVF